MRRVVARCETARGPDFTYLRGTIGPCPVACLQTGVGALEASRTTEAFLEVVEPRVIVATGYAAALHGDLESGDLLVADKLVDGSGHPAPDPDPELLESARRVSGELAVQFGTLATVERVLTTAAEKRRLHETTSALAADMESAGIVEAARSRTTPVLCFRVILDDVATELPIDFSRIVDRRGDLRPLGALRELLLNPRALGSIPGLRACERRAAGSLTAFLRVLVPELSRRDVSNAPE